MALSPDADPVEEDETAIIDPYENSVEVEEYAVEEAPKEGDVTSKAKQSGRAIKDLVVTAAKKTKADAQAKTEEFKNYANDERTVVAEEALAIQDLGPLRQRLIEKFEDTLGEIGKYPYDDQEKMLVGYRKVLAEELNVVNARLSLAKRVPSAEPMGVGEAPDAEISGAA